LAAVTGRLCAITPYSSHKKVPTVKTTYIDNDIPSVFFVRMVLIACGKNEIVVQKAAAKPIISI